MPKSKAVKAVEKPKHEYLSLLQENKVGYQNRLIVCIPMTGLLRAEWVLARFGQIIPTNWSQVDVMQWINTYSPLRYMVADARNCCTKKAVEGKFEWILFIDHDVILPPDCFVKMNQYMLKKEYPVVSGIYYTKSDPPEPLIYRGRGNSYFPEWRHGDKVWVDGIHMGCTLIHCSILKAMYEASEEYYVGQDLVRKVFETPNDIWKDPESGNMLMKCGTEDLAWCSRVIQEEWLQKAGWGEHAKKHPKYPFLMDTSIFGRHINEAGQQFPHYWQTIEKNMKGYEGKEIL